MAYENTGKALAIKWEYTKGDTTTTQKLLNTSGVELEPTDIYLLTDEEYTACFNYTIDYMKNTLKWDQIPLLSDSIKTDLISCPVPVSLLSMNIPERVIEVKYETYETGNRKYRIFFACEEEIPLDIQIVVTKVSPKEISTIPVSSSILSARGLTYQFTFTDGSTEKIIEEYKYILSPASITLPNIL